jgi:protein XagA
MLVWSMAPAGAAWVRNSGEAYVQATSSYLTADKFYLADGTKKDIAKFTEATFNLYAEYGITDRLTTGIYAPFRYQEFAENATLTQTARNYTGIGDLVLTNRFNIYNGSVVFSAGLDVGVPTGNNKEPYDLLTGDGEFNFLPQLMLAGGFKAGLPGFYLLSAGYNKRTLGFSDEVHYKLQSGLSAGAITLMASFEGLQSLKNGDASGINNSVLYQNNASFLAWSAGAVYKITDKTNLNLFYKSAFFARNIIAAPSVSLGFGVIF